MKIPGYLFRIVVGGFFFIISILVFGEGTKEIMPDQTKPARILLDPSSGRDPFALYSTYLTKPDYRFFIHISDPATEKIYFGTGQQRTGSNSNTTETHINWRIHRSDGTVECQGLTPIVHTAPTLPDQGYISTYAQALAGPSVVNAAGYDALSCTPTVAGDYFITFEAAATRTFDFIDITVVDVTTSTAIPGRVFAKCWQIRNPTDAGGNYYTYEGKMFIYSTDGIVTKFDPNDLEGRDFSITSNESGCYPVDATHNAQQARRSQPGPTSHNYPEYKIFLNDPDNAAYPDGVIGQLVTGSVVATPNCNGTIDFTFETSPSNALGTVEIDLELSTIVPQPIPAYADRVLIVNNVPGGLYTINWDGKDANGVTVAVGSTFPFTLKYTKGLTNLPLWDVEDNLNGFKVSLVRPVLIPPLADPDFYWDDQLVGSGTATINTTPPGCVSTTGCHGWGRNPWPAPYNQTDWGDQKTINTWWYLVSNSTQPVTVTFIHSPGTLIQSPPAINDVCQGQTVTFTVNADANSTSYKWVYDWGTQTTTSNSLTLLIPTNAIAGLTHMYVNGVNADCGNGAILDLPYTIHALPTGNIAGNTSTCVNSSETYSTVAGMTTYNWSVTGGTINSGQFTSAINVTWNTVGTGVVQITFTDPFGCGVATPGIENITVNPLPTPVITGVDSICVNTTGTYGTSNLMSNYNWLVSPGGTITSGQGTRTVDILWTTTGIHSVSVNYTDQNGCSSTNPVIYHVTVNPRPVPVITGNAAVCLNLTGTYSTTAGMSNYTWNVPPGGIIQSGGGTNSITITWNVAGSDTVTVNYIDLKGCAASLPVKFPVTVNPLPVTTIAGSGTVCQDFTTPYSYQTTVIDAQTAYSWQIITGSGTIANGNTSNPVSINWTAPGNAQLKVTATSGPGCVDSQTIPLVINPKPDVSMVLCFDNVTTRSAKRFILKGGKPFYTVPASPVQGDYIVTPATPALQFDAASGNYYFNPSLVPGNNTVTFSITYQYTNLYGCPNKSAGVSISVQGANPACGATMTDPRDGKTYVTATFNGKCWMSQNLNFPKAQAPIATDQPQTDNCIVEKYCPPSDATCSTNGGAYYQWDELIQFGNTDYPYQGLCPPGWHVPTVAEWQQLIDFADPAFTAPNANALAGSTLKDPFKNFDALLNGVYFLNSTWAYTGPAMTATMFWTSTQDVNDKVITRGLNNPYNPSVSKYSASRADAFPVRCVKD